MARLPREFKYTIVAHPATIRQSAADSLGSTDLEYGPSSRVFYHAVMKIDDRRCTGERRRKKQEEEEEEVQMTFFNTPAFH